MVRKYKIIRMFRKNAVLGENIKFCHSGGCKNLSGIQNIKIGEILSLWEACMHPKMDG